MKQREIKFRAFENEKMHYFDLSDTIAPNMEMKVMQYTGMKDKNGIDIYQGDIVIYRGEHIGVIEYWVGQICVGYRYRSNNVTFALKMGNSMYMEVIGNIYQHKHLLK